MIVTNQGGEPLYTRRFFQAFAAVALFMTGNALQFHFGQYVAHVGYGVDTLGLILSVAMLGTLLMRLRIGHWIDRFGCKATWVGGGLVVAVGVGLLPFARALWLILILRAAVQMATATVMTTVAVFAAQIAPAKRRAESIGTMGLAGFLGMMTGPTLGDWIFAGGTDSTWPYRVFFWCSAVCSLAACAVMMSVSLPPQPSPSADEEHGLQAAAGTPPSQLRVVLEHWPGAVLLIGVLFTLVFCIQSLFLERLADEAGFRDIKMFFLVYCPTAMTVRILLRRMPERVGRTRTLILGLLLLAAGLSQLIGISSQWQLIPPGLIMGAGHALIFPSMVDLAAERLPHHRRGTGTSLILGAGDVGMLFGFAGLGELIDNYGFDFALKALVYAVLVTSAVFAFARRQDLFPSGAPRAE